MEGVAARRDRQAGPLPALAEPGRAGDRRRTPQGPGPSSTRSPTPASCAATSWPCCGAWPSGSATFGPDVIHGLMADAPDLDPAFFDVMGGVMTTLLDAGRRARRDPHRRRRPPRDAPLAADLLRHEMLLTPASRLRRDRCPGSSTRSSCPWSGLQQLLERGQPRPPERLHPRRLLGVRHPLVPDRDLGLRLALGHEADRDPGRAVLPVRAERLGRRRRTTRSSTSGSQRDRSSSSANASNSRSTGTPRRSCSRSRRSARRRPGRARASRAPARRSP